MGLSMYLKISINRANKVTIVDNYLLECYALW